MKECRSYSSLLTCSIYDFRKNGPSKSVRDPLLSWIRYFICCSYFRSDSFRIVPIFLSLHVSLPSAFRIVPGGRPCFFSKVPTVQSLLVLRAISSLLVFNHSLIQIHYITIEVAIFLFYGNKSSRRLVDSSALLESTNQQIHE